MFDSLQVIELQIPRTGAAYGDSLKALRLLCNAFCPESCTRVVLIFFEVAKIDKFERHFKTLNALADKSTHLHQFEAYRFLLSWIVGGEYRVAKPGYKISMFNDPHILGRFKERWNDFEKRKGVYAEQIMTEAQRVRFTDLITPLLTDAHEIRKRVENGTYAQGKGLGTTLDTVLNSVILSRKYGLPVVYDSMHLDSYQTNLLEFVDKKLENLSKQLDCHPEDSDAYKGLKTKIDFYSEARRGLETENGVPIIEPPILINKP